MAGLLGTVKFAEIQFERPVVVVHGRLTSCLSRAAGCRCLGREGTDSGSGCFAAGGTGVARNDMTLAIISRVIAGGDACACARRARGFCYPPPWARAAQLDHAGPVKVAVRRRHIALRHRWRTLPRRSGKGTCSRCDGGLPREATSGSRRRIRRSRTETRRRQPPPNGQEILLKHWGSSSAKSCRGEGTTRRKGSVAESAGPVEMELASATLRKVSRCALTRMSRFPSHACVEIAKPRRLFWAVRTLLSGVSRRQR